jgi:hypothetical protein
MISGHGPGTAKAHSASPLSIASIFLSTALNPGLILICREDYKPSDGPAPPEDDDFLSCGNTFQESVHMSLSTANVERVHGSLID